MFVDWPKEERSRNVKMMLREKLPVENYELFKYVVEFLVQVNNRNICDKSINDVNVFFIIFSFRLWIVKILTK